MQKLIKSKDYIIFYSIVIYLLIFFHSYYESINTINLSASLYRSSLVNEILSSFRNLKMITYFTYLGVVVCFISIYPKAIRTSSVLLMVFIIILIANNLLLLQLHYAFLNLTLMHIFLFFQKDSIITIHKYNIHSKFLLLILFYLVFTTSGLSKLFYSGWFDGQALSFSITRKNILQFLLNPKFESLFYLILGYVTLFIEIFSLPLLLYKKSRLLIFVLNTFLHLFIIVFMPKILNISIALLLVHFYLYESEFMVKKTEN